MDDNWYKCYINGCFYGVGSLGYMKELITDYVVNCQMYGRDSCEFKVEKIEDLQVLSTIVEAENNLKGAIQ